jgi:YggT family protein
MLFSILNFFFTAVIIILFVRYFVEPYRYYGFGPVMVGVITLTESILRPVKQNLPRRVSFLDEHLPLAAIAVVMIIRGFLIWLIGAGSMMGSAIVGIHLSPVGRLSLLHSLEASFCMGILLVAEMLVAFLFASLMISRRGIMMGSNAGFKCFQDKTFAVFQFAQKYIRSNNLIYLFLASSAIVLAIGAFSASILNFSFLYGGKIFLVTFIDCLFEMLLALIQTYWMVLLLAILSSWIGADHFSMVVQVVRSMSDPYLEFFRRLMPWARIDFIDLSPIVAFLCLNPGLVALLASIRGNILSRIMSAMAMY